MLNKDSERELVYTVKIDGIEPLPGYDRVESAIVGGWRVVVRKGQFKPGDYAIYFEIDSKVPEVEPFLFLEPKHFKIKTQKMCKSISQGLLMSFDDFIIDGVTPAWLQQLQDKVAQGKNIEHEFLTAALGVTYSVAEDNQRKAAPADKYKKMAQRHPKIFKKSWAKWLMRRKWGKDLMFLFFGKKKDKKNPWPGWVKKTNEERIQNLPHILSSKDEWVVTEKIDGSSTTATYKRKGKKKHEYYICSRNVVFDKPNKGCYYEFNPYIEMSEKYHFEEVLGDLVEKYNLEWATLQGEVYGGSIQKRDYCLEGHEFAGFNLIFSDRGRLNSVESAKIMSTYGIPWVPILHDHFKLLDTVDEMLDFATGDSAIDGGLREGLVFRSQDGTQSFKAVSNQFLLIYHQ